MRYIVTYNGKKYIYNAKSATEALEKLNNRKVYGRYLIFNYRISLIDADTRGEIWAEAYTTDDDRRIFAIAEGYEEDA